MAKKKMRMKKGVSLVGLQATVLGGGYKAVRSVSKALQGK